MNFEPEFTLASVLPAYKDLDNHPPCLPDERTPNPDFKGVSFTIHQLTEGRRLKARLVIADVNLQIRQLMQEQEEAAQLKDDDEVKIALNRRIGLDIQDLVSDKLTPIWVRTLLVSVNGLTIKGKPATVESLIESGPPDLYNEISQHIKVAAGMTEKARGESAPPTTSNAQADGRISDSSATTVEPTATT